MKLIYLEWADAVSSGAGWADEDSVKIWDNDSEWWIKQCGFLIKETDKYILLCGHYKPKDEFTDEQFGNVQKIPKGWIRKRKIIKL